MSIFVYYHAFLPRFDPIGVFCNVKLVLEPIGFTAPNVVDNAGVLPNRLLLVVQDDPKPPDSHAHCIILILISAKNEQFYATQTSKHMGVQISIKPQKESIHKKHWNP